MIQMTHFMYQFSKIKMKNVPCSRFYFVVICSVSKGLILFGERNRIKCIYKNGCFQVDV